MSRFLFQNIESLHSVDLNNGNFLWIWHANKIPPHIGASVNGAYYSLKVSGKDNALPVKRVQRIIQDKKIPFVAIKLVGDIKDLEMVFEKYSVAKAGEISCLEPIKEFLSVNATCSKLEDLLMEIHKKGQVGNIAGLYLPQDFTYLPEYTKDDINIRLAKLEDAQRREYIS